MTKAVKIPCVGGPLDGLEREHQIKPCDGSEYNYRSHCYVFSYEQWSWVYKQQWRRVTHTIASGIEIEICYRTYSELLRELGYLQTTQPGWTAHDSVNVQARVKESMGEDIWKFKEHSNGTHHL